jgi:hypothetical protein
MDAAEIRLLDGSTSRPTKLKAIQLLRAQQSDCEAKRRVSVEAEALATKEERRAKELGVSVLSARKDLAAHEKHISSSPLGPYAQPAEVVTQLKRLRTQLAVSESESIAQNGVAARERAVALAAERSVQEVERTHVKNADVAAAFTRQAQEDLENRRERSVAVNTGELDASNALEVTQ